MSSMVKSQDLELLQASRLDLLIENAMGATISTVTGGNISSIDDAVFRASVSLKLS